MIDYKFEGKLYRFPDDFFAGVPENRRYEFVSERLDLAEYEVTDGVKFDSGKPRWGLLPYDQLEQVVEILTFGAKKYKDDNWKVVEGGKERYFDALMRHVKDYRTAKERNIQSLKYDNESGKNHLAHVICNALFLMWFDDKEKSNGIVESLEKTLNEDNTERDNEVVGWFDNDLFNGTSDDEFKNNVRKVTNLINDAIDETVDEVLNENEDSKLENDEEFLNLIKTVTGLWSENSDIKSKLQNPDASTLQPVELTVDSENVDKTEDKKFKSNVDRVINLINDAIDVEYMEEYCSNELFNFIKNFDSEYAIEDLDLYDFISKLESPFRNLEYVPNHMKITGDLVVDIVDSHGELVHQFSIDLLEKEKYESV